MWHLIGQDDGEFDKTANDLLGIVLIPRRLINQFLLAFFFFFLDIGGGIVQKMADDLLRALIVAFHQVTATSVAVHFDRTVVLIEDFAVFGANCDGYVQAFEIIKLVHNACNFSAKIEFL